MADQRYVALFGVKDVRLGRGATAYSATAVGGLPQCFSLIKISVGGGDRAIWDLSKCQTYIEEIAGISPSAVLIPQNTIYTIQYYTRFEIDPFIAEVVLDGIVVEPRGLLLSP